MVKKVLERKKKIKKISLSAEADDGYPLLLDENKHTITILDVNPISDGHILIVSKRHFSDLPDVLCHISDSQNLEFRMINEFIKYLFLALERSVSLLKKKLEPKPTGFNFITNSGYDAFQSIFHFHLHVIPKFVKEEGFIWSSNKKLRYEKPSDVLKILIGDGDGDC